MPTDKGLPGNPYSTCRNAWNDGDAIEETVMDKGLSGDTLVASAIMTLRDAVMALAHEQRTANLIHLANSSTTFLTRTGMEARREAEARLGHGKDPEA